MKILDWLFGKRYREGWPRGVKPMFPELEIMRKWDPAWSRATKDWPAREAIELFYKRNPRGG